MSGIGRNGTFTANLRFRYFANSTSETIQEPLSKISDRNSHENPLIFKNFWTPLKREKKAQPPMHFIRALALLRYLECSAVSIHFVYEIRAPASTATLKTRCHNTLQQAIDFQFSTLCSKEICHVNKHFDGQLALLGSLLSRTERRVIFKCVFLKIMFCSERSISTYPAHIYSKCKKNLLLSLV